MRIIRSFNVGACIGVLNLWLLITLIAIYLAITGEKTLNILNITAATNLGGTLALVWYFTSKGRSFLFLFTSLLFLFLGGRFFTSLLGYDDYPDYINFGGDTYVGTHVAIKYAILMHISFAALLVGMLLTPNIEKNEHLKCTNNEKFTNFLNICIFFSLPFYIYKNYLYYTFLSANGGYIAMYMTTEHLEQAGFFTRIMALVCQSLLLARVFLSENRSEYKVWMIFFCLVFSTELLIGLRGKYFVTIMALFFLYIVRYNLKLSIFKLIMVATFVSLISVAVEAFREQKEESTLVGFLLVGFLHQQSVSSDVVKAVIAFSDKLGTGFEYLFRQFFIPFLHPTQVGGGWFLSDDLSRLVMPEAYSKGFGTGSSYIAELYLIGGFGLVFISNVLLAIYLKNIKFHPNYTDFFKFIFLIGVLYYPRSTLNDPFHSALRYGIVFCLCYFVYSLIKKAQFNESINK